MQSDNETLKHWEDWSTENSTDFSGNAPLQAPILSLGADGFRFAEVSPYGIKVAQPVCYPPQTLLEGAPYKRAGNLRDLLLRKK